MTECSNQAAGSRLRTCEHVTVYRNEEYFSAWPFNGGMWQFADGEIAVGFVRGRCNYDAETTRHSVVDRQNGEHMVIRSHDGGVSWDTSDLTEVYRRPALDETLKTATAEREDIPAADPWTDGLCLLAGFGIPPKDDRTAAFIMRSLDRGRSWSAPIRPRAHGYNFLSIRPGYCLRPDGMILIFGIANDAEHAAEKNAFPVIYASSDGGARWSLHGHIDPVPCRPMCIMGDPLILKSGSILAALRREHGDGVAYTQIYHSLDGGRSWGLLSRPNDWGAPANLVQLADGRVICVYGYRCAPYGIRAVVSEDDGVTWGPELILRDDGGSRDLGYPRTVLRADGTVVTVYYFNDKTDPVHYHGGIRYIAATLWTV